MTFSEANKIIGAQPAWAVQAMVKALSLHPWLNTAEETKRLEAARIVLGKAPLVSRQNEAIRSFKHSLDD
tara:strand:- start:42 stop:251 length:210 start_codon:yes stop_codon:yes gene_type:complete